MCLEPCCLYLLKSLNRNYLVQFLCVLPAPQMQVYGQLLAGLLGFFPPKPHAHFTFGVKSYLYLYLLLMDQIMSFTFD